MTGRGTLYRSALALYRAADKLVSVQVKGTKVAIEALSGQPHQTRVVGRVEKLHSSYNTFISLAVGDSPVTLSEGTTRKARSLSPIYGVFCSVCIRCTHLIHDAENEVKLCYCGADQAHFKIRLVCHHTVIARTVRFTRSLKMLPHYDIIYLMRTQMPLRKAEELVKSNAEQRVQLKGKLAEAKELRAEERANARAKKEEEKKRKVR